VTLWVTVSFSRWYLLHEVCFLREGCFVKRYGKLKLCCIIVGIFNTIDVLVNVTTKVDFSFDGVNAFLLGHTWDIYRQIWCNIALFVGLSYYQYIFLMKYDCESHYVIGLWNGTQFRSCSLKLNIFLITICTYWFSLQNGKLTSKWCKKVT
jgi:hypothetical protein